MPKRKTSSKLNIEEGHGHVEPMRKTASLCPKCLKTISAEIFKRNGKVWIAKKCPEHGEFEDLYFGDYDMYKRFEKWAHAGKGIENPVIDKENPVCPQDCGMCKLHKSHTALANIVVTNRCDLTCFYCFFYAKAMGYVYEPTLDQIRQMLRTLKAQKPVEPNAIQLTGGEPTLREDIIEIIDMCKEEGFDHVQLNTNGIRIANEPEFAERVKKAGVNTLYLSFDGVSPKTNPKNHWEIPKILENCKKAEIGVVLVPTVINKINDHELGAILKFAIKHIDVVRGVNFQPVSLVGRITKADLKKFRITIPDVAERIEKQTSGIITKDDFYPVPTVTAITHFVEAMSKKPKYELTSHFACGSASYLFIDKDGSIIPIGRFVDIEGLMKYLDEKAVELKSKPKGWVLLKMLAKISSFIDKKKQPKNLNLTKLLINVLKKKDYAALGDMHHKSLMVSAMHFMDLYNYDVERVKNCCIHYAQPDGRIVPFCTFNVIPEWYRDKIQKKYSITITQWERRQKRKLNTDLYKRDIEKLKNDPLYNKYYG